MRKCHSDMAYLATLGGYSRDIKFGRTYVDGTYTHTAFSTMLPPNSVSCYFGTGSYNIAPAASSMHVGGVQAALGDGAVRFFSETIDSGTGLGFDDANASGPSPFGAWGALGSICGSESVSF